ncbi:MAG TPA: hypothetical protein VH277_05060 [Gemmatimonadaceae bacterium]|nr:hypothetical protein [Gemmatimonadaceae bacterium]
MLIGEKQNAPIADSARASITACGGSTEPAGFTLNGSFTLDSVDAHHPPIFQYVSQGDSIFRTSMVVTIDQATRRYTSEGLDSTVFASERVFVGAFSIGGPVVTYGDATFADLVHVGRDALWLSGIATGAGRILGPYAFTQASGSSTIYFSKH